MPRPPGDGGTPDEDTLRVPSPPATRPPHIQRAADVEREKRRTQRQIIGGPTRTASPGLYGNTVSTSTDTGGGTPTLTTGFFDAVPDTGTVWLVSATASVGSADAPAGVLQLVLGDGDEEEAQDIPVDGLVYRVSASFIGSTGIQAGGFYKPDDPIVGDWPTLTVKVRAWRLA